MNELLNLWLLPRLGASIIAAVLGTISFALVRPIPTPLAVLAGAVSGLVALTHPHCISADLHPGAILMALSMTACLAALLPATLRWATGAPSPTADHDDALAPLVPLLLAWVWLQAGGALWAAQTGAQLACSPADDHRHWVYTVWPLVARLAPPLLLMRLSLDASAAILHHAAPNDSVGAHADSAILPVLTLAMLLHMDTLLAEPLATLLTHAP